MLLFNSVKSLKQILLEAPPPQQPKFSAPPEEHGEDPMDQERDYLNKFSQQHVQFMRNDARVNGVNVKQVAHDAITNTIKKMLEVTPMDSQTRNSLLNMKLRDLLR